MPINVRLSFNFPRQYGVRQREERIPYGHPRSGVIGVVVHYVVVFFGNQRVERRVAVVVNFKNGSYGYTDNGTMDRIISYARQGRGLNGWLNRNKPAHAASARSRRNSTLRITRF